MADSLHLALTLAGAIGCGLVGGFFYAFSVCVMRALGDQPPAHGIAAMQRINVVVINPWFMTAFLGSALVCVAIAVSALLRDTGSAGLAIGAALLYVLGSLVETMIFNVPRNDVLARVDPNSAEGERVWADYLVSWTRWNHVRTAASIAAAALLTIDVHLRAAY
jgi:uncharacterized membrane protein